jgi:hypothetical protein
MITVRTHKEHTNLIILQLLLFLKFLTAIHTHFCCTAAFSILYDCSLFALDSHCKVVTDRDLGSLQHSSSSSTAVAQLSRDAQALLAEAAQRCVAPLPLYKLWPNRAFEAARARFDSFVAGLIAKHEKALLQQQSSDGAVTGMVM